MKSQPTDPISNHKATRNKYIFFIFALLICHEQRLNQVV